MDSPKHTPPSYSFTTTYEYEGERSAQAITTAVRQQFLFPSWTRPYPQQSLKAINYLNMLDVRSLIVDPRTRKIDFAVEDSRELTEMGRIIQLKEHEDAVLLNFQEEAEELLKKWDKLREMIA